MILNIVSLIIIVLLVSILVFYRNRRKTCIWKEIFIPIDKKMEYEISSLILVVERMLVDENFLEFQKILSNIHYNFFTKKLPDYHRKTISRLFRDTHKFYIREKDFREYIDALQKINNRISEI